MSQAGRAVRDYAIIAIGTLLAIELACFAWLVWRKATAADVGLGEAVSARLHPPPLLDPRVRRPKQDSEYVFLPTTQHAFRAGSEFEGLRVGRHGFILNGDAEPADYPDEPPGQVAYSDPDVVILFDGYDDAIHYNDDGNLRIARRIAADLQAAGVEAPRR